MKVGVFGAGGRMGRSVIRLAAEAGAQIVAAVDRSDLGRDAGLLVGMQPLGVVVGGRVEALEVADVVIDFSAPDASAELFRWAVEVRKPVVSGTTGKGDDLEDAISVLAEVAPVVVAPNFSPGVTLLFELARLASTWAGPAFDAEIVEMHHRAKVDSPSGTAARLATVVGDAKRIETFTHGRSGQVGARPDAEIGVMSLRGGDVVGDHTLILAGPGERIELVHRASSRDIFAHGALRAAAWVLGRDPGSYTMNDVMGLG